MNSGPNALLFLGRHSQHSEPLAALQQSKAGEHDLRRNAVIKIFNNPDFYRHLKHYEFIRIFFDGRSCSTIMPSPGIVDASKAADAVVGDGLCGRVRLQADLQDMMGVDVDTDQLQDEFEGMGAAGQVAGAEGEETMAGERGEDGAEAPRDVELEDEISEGFGDVDDI